MKSNLTTYNNKRDFNKTKEPVGKKKSSKNKLKLGMVRFL